MCLYYFYETCLDEGLTKHTYTHTHTHTHIHTYIFIYIGEPSVMIIIAGNRHGETSSNRSGGCLHFT